MKSELIQSRPAGRSLDRQTARELVQGDRRLTVSLASIRGTEAKEVLSAQALGNIAQAVMAETADVFAVAVLCAERQPAAADTLAWQARVTGQALGMRIMRASQSLR